MRMQEDAEKAKDEEIQRLEADRLRRMTSANTEVRMYLPITTSAVHVFATRLAKKLLNAKHTCVLGE